MRKLGLTLLGALTAACTSVQLPPPGQAEMWVTTIDGEQKLAPQPPVVTIGSATGDETVSIDTSKQFQRIHGFGAAMTDASAQLLSDLPDEQRKTIMRRFLVSVAPNHRQEAPSRMFEALRSPWAVFGAVAIGLYVGAEVSIGSIMLLLPQIGHPQHHVGQRESVIYADRPLCQGQHLCQRQQSLLFERGWGDGLGGRSDVEQGPWGNDLWSDNK